MLCLKESVHLAVKSPQVVQYHGIPVSVLVAGRFQDLFRPLVERCRRLVLGLVGVEARDVRERHCVFRMPRAKDFAAVGKHLFVE